MLLLVSGATGSVERFPDVGRLIVPAARNRPERLFLEPGKWAMDNGAFKAFDRGLFVGMLEQFSEVPGCLFVTVPDVVGNASETLRLWPFWSRLIRGAGYPVAFVAQDGILPDAVPWREMDALFIGGTTEFKLSSMVRSLAGYAKARGMWLHVGRVNSHRRLRFVAQIGGLEGRVSYDGTSTSRFPMVHIPRRLASVKQLRQQPELAL